MDKNGKELKEIVKDKYGKIALKEIKAEEIACCGTDSCCTIDYTVFADDYSQLQGYNPDADLNLGCGLPTEFAQIMPGQTVLDLGSGAGNDCFVARELTGESGRVIGVDMTIEMIQKAKENANRRGFENIEFILGDIENLPLENSHVDVVISNCVLNLVPDKEKAFLETYRVLKSGGHFSVSDVVVLGELPEQLREQAELYAGCISGAIQKEVYLKIITDTGFTDVQVQKEKKIQLPDELLNQFLNEEQVMLFKKGDFGIYSITVFGKRPF